MVSRVTIRQMGAALGVGLLLGPAAWAQGMCSAAEALAGHPSLFEGTYFTEADAEAAEAAAAQGYSKSYSDSGASAADGESTSAYAALLGRRRAARRRKPRRKPRRAGKRRRRVPAASRPKALVSRKGWGGGPARSGGSHRVHTLVVHHTASPLKAYRKAATVRSIQALHQGNGWGDIGYHYVIGPDGRIYRGRPEHQVGTHAPPNTGRLGICLVGNYSAGDKLTGRSREALVRTLAWLARKYKLNPGRDIVGHGDVYATACPGTRVRRNLGSIRKSVAKRLRASAAKS
jgi:hypothetical protein